MKKIQDSTFVLLYLISISILSFVLSKDDPQIEIVECPPSEVQEFEAFVEVEIIAGSSEIINLFVLIKSEGEYFSRFFIDKEYNAVPNVFELPKAYETKLFVWGADRSFYPESFDFYMDVLDDRGRSDSISCSITFADY